MAAPVLLTKTKREIMLDKDSYMLPEREGNKQE